MLLNQPKKSSLLGGGLGSLLLILLLLVGCKDARQEARDTQAAQGSVLLSEARSLCQTGRYDAARDTIQSLRRTCPLAIEARKQAILLMDSVEMLAAQDSLATLPERMDTALAGYAAEYERLSLKAQFFQRKLEHDKK